MLVKYLFASDRPRVIFIDRYTISVIEKRRRVRTTSGRLGMTSKNRRNLESGPAFKERRSFIGAMAALGAGLAGSAVLPATASAEATPDTHRNTKSASVC